MGASRFGAATMLDLLDGRNTERTELEMVRTKPLPFPPEPIRSWGIGLTTAALQRADANGGRRNLWLRTLDRLGLGLRLVTPATMHSTARAGIRVDRRSPERIPGEQCMRVLCRRRRRSRHVGGAHRRPARLLRTWVVSDYDAARAEAVVERLEEPRFVAAQVDASSAEAVADLCREHGITHVLNVVDPRFVMPIFEGAFQAGADYLDTAMSLSRPHPDEPYAEVGVKLGDEQFAQADEWEAAGRLALCGMGVEPGLADVFARYAADHLFSEIDEIGIRDGANLVVEGYDFAPSFSIWTTIEECLNPPVIWEKDRGWFTTEPFSEPEVFDFPEGIGPVEVHQRGARGGAARAAVDRLQAGHVQVRTRRRVHRRPQDAAQARPGPHRAGDGQGTCRSARATSWPPPCPTRRRSATR